MLDTVWNPQKRGYIENQQPSFHWYILRFGVEITDNVIFNTQNISDNVIFECKKTSDNVICYA